MTKKIDSSIELRSKKDLIERFISTINIYSNIDEDWRIFTDKSKKEEIDRIIEEENLKPKPTKNYMSNAFRDGELKSNGTAFADILPPMSMFDKDNIYAKKRITVLGRLKEFFEKYRGV